MKKIQMLPFKAVPFSAIKAAYNPILTLAKQIEVLVFVSTVNQAFFLSIDGVNDYILIRANSEQKISASDLTGLYQYAFAKGTTFYAKDAGIAPASGQFHLQQYFFDPSDLG